MLYVVGYFKVRNIDQLYEYFCDVPNKSSVSHVNNNIIKDVIFYVKYSMTSLIRAYISIDGAGLPKSPD